MLEILKRHLAALQEERAGFKAEMDGIVATVEAEKRQALTDAEQSKEDKESKDTES